jgi:hypothetical protein
LLLLRWYDRGEIIVLLALALVSLRLLFLGSFMRGRGRFHRRVRQ